MDKLPFETYESVAREIAERTGNLLLVRIVLNSYLDVAKTHNWIYPLDQKEYSRVIEALKELEPIALETTRREREAESDLERSLSVLRDIPADQIKVLQ